ncbi:hypothetical protein D3C72_2511400 [compost metagenome]
MFITLDIADELFVRMTFNQIIDVWHGAVHNEMFGFGIFQNGFFIAASFSIEKLLYFGIFNDDSFHAVIQ